MSSQEGKIEQTVVVETTVYTCDLCGREEPGYTDRYKTSEEADILAKHPVLPKQWSSFKMTGYGVDNPGIYHACGDHTPDEFTYQNLISDTQAHTK